MQATLDSPSGRTLVDRVERLSGFLSPAPRDASLRARCGDREIDLRGCFHPLQLSRPDVQGFVGYLVVQEHLPAIVDGCLRIEMECAGEVLPPLLLRVSPVARHLAETYPLDLADYPLPRGARPAEPRPARLVFPGLGGVGGASMNHLFRRKLLRDGGAFTAYSEADDASLWERICAAGPPDYRWVDGHGCYRAADDLGRGSARVTLLREPARRFVSIFHYNSLVHPDRFRFDTLEDFAGSDAARAFTQAAGLARLAGLDVEEGISDADLHAVAAEELACRHALVGITELFEETVFLLCGLAGFDSIGMWWRILAAPKAIDVDGLPLRLRSRIERLVEVDRRLYDRARQALSERVRSDACGPELEAYKAAAKRQPELPDRDRFVECLRWRQVLLEAELGAWRARELGACRAR